MKTHELILKENEEVRLIAQVGPNFVSIYHYHYRPDLQEWMLMNKVMLNFKQLLLLTADMSKTKHAAIVHKQEKTNKWLEANELRATKEEETK